MLLNLVEKGNVSKVVEALITSLENSSYTYSPENNPWYFPSISEYTSLLEKQGLEVTFAALFDRPTPLSDGDTGMANWLKMFASSFFSQLSSQQQNKIIEEVTAKLKPTLYDEGIWKVDYRRIRVIAAKN